MTSSRREQILCEVRAAVKHLPRYEFERWLAKEIRRCRVSNSVGACNARRENRPSVIVTVNAMPLRLTPQQADVFRLLLAANGGIVPRDQIRTVLAKDTGSIQLSANHVNVVISRLRNQLRGIGYDNVIGQVKLAGWWMILNDPIGDPVIGTFQAMSQDMILPDRPWPNGSAVFTKPETGQPRLYLGRVVQEPDGWRGYAWRNDTHDQLRLEPTQVAAILALPVPLAQPEAPATQRRTRRPSSPRGPAAQLALTDGSS